MCMLFATSRLPTNQDLGGVLNPQFFLKSLLWEFERHHNPCREMHMTCRSIFHARGHTCSFLPSLRFGCTCICCARYAWSDCLANTCSKAATLNLGLLFVIVDLPTKNSHAHDLLRAKGPKWGKCRWVSLRCPFWRKYGSCICEQGLCRTRFEEVSARTIISLQCLMARIRCSRTCNLGIALPQPRVQEDLGFCTQIWQASTSTRVRSQSSGLKQGFGHVKVWIPC